MAYNEKRGFYSEVASAMLQFNIPAMYVAEYYHQFIHSLSQNVENHCNMDSTYGPYSHE